MHVFTFLGSPCDFFGRQNGIKLYREYQRPCRDRTETTQSSCNLHDLRTKIAQCPCDVLMEVVQSLYADSNQQASQADSLCFEIFGVSLSTISRNMGGSYIRVSLCPTLTHQSNQGFTQNVRFVSPCLTCCCSKTARATMITCSRHLFCLNCICNWWYQNHPFYIIG